MRRCVMTDTDAALDAAIAQFIAGGASRALVLQLADIGGAGNPCAAARILQDTEDLAVRLIRLYLPPGWSLRWNTAKVQAGVCYPAVSEIRLSAPLMARWPASEREDTIRHEIAHGLAPWDVHGPEWMAACRVTGAIPEARYDAQELPQIAGRLVGRCEAGHYHGRRHRQPKRRQSCNRCSGVRGFDEEYLITYSEEE